MLSLIGISLCNEALQLRRITFEASSGSVLEKVARGEAVHSVRSLSVLKRRLHNGRRCYGLFHHSLAEPLAFVHIALTANLARLVISLLASRLSYISNCYIVLLPIQHFLGVDR